jgi:DNA-binding XRE family transcriptional regulator
VAHKGLRPVDGSSGGAPLLRCERTRLVPVDVPAVTIGAAIRNARETRGVTQTQLQAWTGIPQPALSAWETGSRTPRTQRLETIAIALEVGFAYRAGEWTVNS